jgi:hypothetical protein
VDPWPPDDLGEGAPIMRSLFEIDSKLVDIRTIRRLLEGRG